MSVNSKHYRVALWDLLKDTIAEQSSRHVYITCKRNKYNYHININHPDIFPLWVLYCKDWENNDNVIKTNDNLWTVYTCIGSYQTERCWDYEDRRLKFEMLIFKNEYWLNEIIKEAETFGESFYIRTGIKLDDLLLQAKQIA